MYALTMKLLQMSLQGALLIFAAALIRTALLRFLPKQMLCLLWVPAILALLIPLPTLFSLSLDLPEPGREEPILAEGDVLGCMVFAALPHLLAKAALRVFHKPREEKVE